MSCGFVVRQSKSAKCRGPMCGSKVSFLLRRPVVDKLYPRFRVQILRWLGVCHCAALVQQGVCIHIERRRLRQFPVMTHSLAQLAAVSRMVFSRVPEAQDEPTAQAVTM